MVNPNPLPKEWHEDIQTLSLLSMQVLLVRIFRARIIPLREFSRLCIVLGMKSFRSVLGHTGFCIFGGVHRKWKVSNTFLMSLITGLTLSLASVSNDIQCAGWCLLHLQYFLRGHFYTKLLEFILMYSILSGNQIFSMCYASYHLS